MISSELDLYVSIQEGNLSFVVSLYLYFFVVIQLFISSELVLAFPHANAKNCCQFHILIIFFVFISFTQTPFFPPNDVSSPLLRLVTNNTKSKKQMEIGEQFVSVFRDTISSCIMCFICVMLHQ